MTSMIELHPAHDEMPDHDRAFRREVCERFIETIRELQLPVSNRILRLITRYEQGELSISGLEREIQRPFFH